MDFSLLIVIVSLSVGGAYAILGYADKVYRDNLKERPNRKYRTVATKRLPCDVSEAMPALLDFLSRRWHRIDLFDPDRGVIIFANIYSRWDAQFCDVRLKRSDMGETVLEVRVGTKLGLYPGNSRQQINEMVLAMLHAAILAGVSKQIGTKSGTEGISPSN